MVKCTKNDIENDLHIPFGPLKVCHMKRTGSTWIEPWLRDWNNRRSCWQTFWKWNKIHAKKIVNLKISQISLNWLTFAWKSMNSWNFAMNCVGSNSSCMPSFRIITSELNSFMYSNNKVEKAMIKTKNEAARTPLKCVCATSNVIANGYVVGFL